MNEIRVTLRGNVATDPKRIRFDNGDTMTTFRLASAVRYLDRERNEWVSREPTFVTVNCRRKALASNAATSVRKGHPLVVTGTLRHRAWTSSERSGLTLEVDVETLGHDLNYGTTEFVRIVRAERIHAAQEQDADDMAYVLAEDTVGGRVPTDVTGFTVLDDDEVPDDAAALDGFVPESAVA